MMNVTWKDLHSLKGAPAEGKILSVEIVQVLDEYKHIRQTILCKDEIGDTRYIAAYTKSKEIFKPKEIEGEKKLILRNPRYHYFADGKGGCKISEKDLDFIEIVSSNENRDKNTTIPEDNDNTTIFKEKEEITKSAFSILVKYGENIKAQKDIKKEKIYSVESNLRVLFENPQHRLWLEVDESQSSLIYQLYFSATKKLNSMLSKSTKAMLTERSDEILISVCDKRRKKDMIALLDAGVKVSSSVIIKIFEEVEAEVNNDFVNKLALQLSIIHLESKNDIKLVLSATANKLGKNGKKSLMSALKRGEVDMMKRNTKKQLGPFKIVTLPPEIVKKENLETNEETKPISNRQQQKRKPIDTKRKIIAEKYLPDMEQLFKWYENDIHQSIKEVQQLSETVFEEKNTKGRKDNSSLLNVSNAKLEKISVSSSTSKATKNQERNINNSSVISKSDNIDLKKILTIPEITKELTQGCSLPEGDEESQEKFLTNIESQISTSFDKNFMKASDSNNVFCVHITEKVDKWFRTRSKKNLALCKRVICRLRMLSTGRWPYVLRKPLQTRASSKAVKLYEAKIDAGSRIIWELTPSFSPRLSSYDRIFAENIIRVWDIVEDHDNLTRGIDKAVTRIEIDKSGSTVQSSLDRIEKCYRRSLDCMLVSELENYVEINPNSAMTVSPGAFPMKQFSIKLQQETEKAHRIYPPANYDETQYNIMKFYELNEQAIQILLRCDEETKLPFSVGPEEHRVINYRSTPERSLLLMGRSGTGKTTCLILRMFAKYMAFIEENPQPRLLFLTENELLRNEVRRSFESLSMSFQEEQETSGVEAKQNKSTMFVTSNELLDILDSSLPGERFFSSTEAKERIMLQKSSKNSNASVIRGIDRFFCSHISNDLNDNTKNSEVPMRNSNRSIRNEMTYSLFVKYLFPDYYQRKSFSSTSLLDPSLIWLEIKSYIKGSCTSVNTEKTSEIRGKFLSFEEYLSLPRKQSRIDETQRRYVYEIYERYEKLKRNHHLYDKMDLVYNLVVRAVASNYKLVDAVYVDEVQDLTQLELFLLTRISTDPNSFLLAGDTAQSIAVGVGFRFTDSKQIFYEHFGGNEPDLLTLVHSYRSHAGVLKLAASVVELLYYFFGDSLDKLPPDTGLFNGPSPTIIQASSVQELMLTVQGSKRETRSIEFGSSQVIIVPNEESKNELVKNFQLDRDFVMTVQESKGLEFDDVLLYNFFSNSQAQQIWRVVTNYKKAEIESYYSSLSNYPTNIDLHWNEDGLPKVRKLRFNREKHKVLEIELKHLYTAITRSRVNVFFIESKKDISKPMLNYFRARNLINFVDDHSIENGYRIDFFGKVDSKEDWQKRGDYYLENADGQRRNACLRLAAKCFEKAGNVKKHDQTLAYLSYLEMEDEQDIKDLTPTSKNNSKSSLIEMEKLYQIAIKLLSAEDFTFLSKAGMCLTKIGDVEYKNCARIFELYAHSCYVKRYKELLKKENCKISDLKIKPAPSDEKKVFSFAGRLLSWYIASYDYDSKSSPIEELRLLSLVIDAIRNFLSSCEHSDLKEASNLLKSYGDRFKKKENEEAKLMLNNLFLRQKHTDHLYDPLAFYFDALSKGDERVLQVNNLFFSTFTDFQRIKK